MVKSENCENKIIMIETYSLHDTIVIQAVFMITFIYVICF